MKFEIIDQVFYFDVVTINSIMEVQEIEEFLNVEELSSHCEKIWIGEASNTGKYHGYKSKIEAYDATDGYFHELSRFDLTDNIANITYLEITRDIEFKTEKMAEAFKFHQERNRIRKWERNRFSVKETIYRGKKVGKFTPNYEAMYPAKDNSGIVHHEFRLLGKRTIQRILGTDLNKISAEALYLMMEKKYHAQKTINQKKLLRAMTKAGINVKRAEIRIGHLRTYMDLREYIEKIQSQVRHRKKIAVLNKRRYRSSKYDKGVMGLKPNRFMG